MSEEYPVTLDGETIGTLTVTQEGLLQVYTADCTAAEGLLRLSVYGEKEGYLGVLMPDGKGRARLRKSFTRAALSEIPKDIRIVSRSGESSLLQAPGETETGQEPTEETAEQTAPAETDAPAQPTVQWRRSAGGALLGTANGVKLLAVPLKNGVAPAGDAYQQRHIEDGEYAVFELKNGRVLSE